MFTPMLIVACTPAPDALSGQRVEVALRRAACAPMENARSTKPSEQQHYCGDAEETQLLADDGEEKIGVRLREVKQPFHARAQSDAEPFAPPKGDQSVG